MVHTTHTWDSFTAEDHHTWHFLFERQSRILKDRASQEILKGMKKLDICSNQIPRFEALNEILQKATGFSIIPVRGFIPEDLFFGFLAQRKFPSTCFIRKPPQLDYLQEPDIFHDVFGHVPLLVNPVFADFMEAFGRKGLEAINHGCLKLAAALYWFTVEFGLIQEAGNLRIYGAGILSSKGESIYALEDAEPKRIPFHVDQAMHTFYRTDILQDTYFVIESFDDLFEALQDLDWQTVKGK
jgi:phenylalanine-4-hydroxylase